MSEGNSHHESLYGAPQTGEQASETQEQFSERYKKAQAAIKQIQKEETRKKQDDDALAKLIVQFLGQGKTVYFLLISRLIAKNIPSDFILSIIALVYVPAKQVISKKIIEHQLQSSDVNQEESSALFQPEEKQEIDIWTANIMSISKKESKRILKTCTDSGQMCDEGIRLFSEILREYLENFNHENLRMDNLQSFGKAFFQKVILHLTEENKDISFSQHHHE